MNSSLQQIEEDVMKDLKFRKVTDDNHILNIPCDYNNAQQYLEQNNFFNDKSDRVILMIDGIDRIAAKNGLWEILFNFYGRNKAEELVPKSWLTYDSQMDDFYTYCRFNKGKQYIMKKNIQRQSGLHIITNPDDAKDAAKNGYVVIQEILSDPYILNGRKINLRVYILITCGKNGKKLFVYGNGFMYYSKDKYTDGKSYDQIVTTGYIDRQVYEENPLTHEDFYKFLDVKHGPGTSLKFKKTLYTLFKNIFNAINVSVCTVSNNNVFANLFGCDVQPNGNLNEIKLIEVNKGSNLQKMSDRDGKLKSKLISDQYEILGLSQTSPDNLFIEVS
jgi:hypothetical protein